MAVMPNGTTTGGGEVQEFEDDAIEIADSDKLKAIIDGFMACGWSEADARRFADDMLLEKPSQGTA